MPTITSAQSGLHSAASTWVGGVVPGLGDKPIVAANHTITVAGAWATGDDTSTGITINGTLRISRSVSTTLTCRGDLYIAPGGSFDCGTEADPIPASVTATIIINDSAVMAHNKWGIRTEDVSATGWAGFRVWGAWKRPYTFLSAPVAATDTVVQVLDANGWTVGDIIGFQPPAGGLGPIYRAIDAITPTGGTTAQLTLSGSLGRTQNAGNGVLNLTRNVRIVGQLGQTWRTHISLRISAGSATTERIELGPATIIAGGGSSNTWMMSGLNIHPQSNGNMAPFVKKINGPVVTSVMAIFGTSVQFVAAGRNMVNYFTGQAAPYYVEAIYTASAYGDGSNLQFYNGVSVKHGPECVFLGGANLVNTGYSQGGVDCEVRGRVWGAFNAVAGSGVGVRFKGVDFASLSLATTMLAGGGVEFEDCSFGLSAELSNVRNTFQFQTGSLCPVTLRNPQVTDNFGVHRTASVIRLSHPANSLSIFQINGDPARNERYSMGGRVHRDATRTRRSTGSVCLASWFDDRVLSMPLSTKVAAGATLRIKGAVWIEASYLPGDAPGISLSATGLATVNWSAPAVADQWHEFDLQITNTNAYPTDVAITLTARSNANSETARVWFDGIFADPWSGSVRHHGFQWLAQTALIADPRITLSEAAALALPVSVDHTAQTITVSGAVTARQVFEACMADLVQTANQTRAVHITSATGDSFETSYTVVTSGAGVIAGAYEDATGRHVTISAPALIAGSRVQVYDLTTATELYNAVLATTGLLLPVTWTADHTIRLRAEHETMKPMDEATVLSSAGATFLNVQDPDTVYLTNGIDGATCTEFSADGPNVEVDISDPDGVTSVQRLYAWAQWYQTTATGIASDFFGAIEAVDAATYLIDQTKADITLDNVGTLPVRVIGGYLARRDGQTVIAPTSGSIQMDPGKAYLAGADGLARESTVQTVLALSLG